MKATGVVTGVASTDVHLSADSAATSAARTRGAKINPVESSHCAPSCRLTPQFSGRALPFVTWHFISHGPLQLLVRRLAPRLLTARHHDPPLHSATCETQRLPGPPVPVQSKRVRRRPRRSHFARPRDFRQCVRRANRHLPLTGQLAPTLHVPAVATNSSHVHRRTWRNHRY